MSGKLPWFEKLDKVKMSRTNKTDIRDFDEQTGGNDHHAHFKNAPDHDGGDGDV